jgi:hypothetical protein
METFLCVCLLNENSFYLSSTKSYGRVDIRSRDSELKVETEALEESIRSFELKLNHDYCMRVVTLVDAKCRNEALREAELLFEEVIDCIVFETMTFKRPYLTKAGYTVNMSSMLVQPIWSKADLVGGPVFGISRDIFPQASTSQYLLSTDRGEITEKVIRSNHWYRLSRQEVNSQLKFLFNWFAIEVLCKVGDEDNIIPKIMLNLGFFDGQFSQLVNKQILEILGKHPTYKDWRKEVRRRLELARNYRNDTVHNAYRRNEISNEEINRYDRILSMAYPRIRKRYIACLSRYKPTTQKEVWERIPLVINLENNLVDDILRIIVYSLEHPNEFSRES